jgi:hypothetical protein
MNRKMMSALVIVGVVAAAAVGCSDDSDDQGPDPEIFTASLNAAAEPPVGGVPVASTAVGTATLELVPGGISYTVTVTSPLTTGVNNAHIHGPLAASGAGSQSAGVVLNLNPNFGLLTGTVAQGVFQGTGTSLATVTMDSLKAMIRNGNAYVNVHTTRFVGGEIRGQLVKAN